MSTEQVTQAELKDAISIERLNKLHPKVRDTFRAFIISAEIELNTTLRITQGLRTVAEQNALYEQGRTKPGNIVTNAKGGSSYHNYGLAIDVVEMVAGQPNWNFNYARLKPISDRFGITWGGTFKSIVDRPHFEISLGYTTQRLKTMRKDGNGYVIL